MARCEGCNKFASVSLTEPAEEPDVIGDGEMPVESINITATFELELETECCGMNGGNATAEMDDDTEITHAMGCEESSLNSDLTIEPDDYYEPAGRPMRYQRHHYGVKVTGTIKCDSCGAVSGDLDFSTYEQVSSFEAW